MKQQNRHRALNNDYYATQSVIVHGAALTHSFRKDLLVFNLLSLFYCFHCFLLLSVYDIILYLYITVSCPERCGYSGRVLNTLPLLKEMYT